ncbi:MAG: glutamate formiminotransferase [Actinomycetota bacterium]|nr:glutamate formiminotransferase [Actinomycetota bacterium]
MGADDAAKRGQEIPVIAVPNVSEGVDVALLAALAGSITRGGSRVLDVHSDAVHNRSVFTITGDATSLARSAAELALGCKVIDLREQSGVHPRLGSLDVFPFVWDGSDPSPAIDLANRAGAAIASSADLPVFLYGAAARRPETRSLPELRRGGLLELRRRIAEEGLLPDEGPADVEPSRGVVCVGARGPLIAFNVWLRSDARTARRIAARVRSSGGGPPGVRALGWSMGDDRAQVSMNLTSPGKTGIDQAFEAVATLSREEDVAITACEIVGLPPERYLPDEKREAARLLIKPGRSLESALRSN